MTKHGVLLTQFVFRRGINNVARIMMVCAACSTTVSHIADHVLLNDLVDQADAHVCPEVTDGSDRTA